MNKREALIKYFGHEQFRPGQQQVVDSLLQGKDVLAVMPTGAGKSLCFQLPAILLSGVTLVISPLVSLMKDQVSALVQKGISAAFINHTQTDEEMAEVLLEIRRSLYKLIYVSPERLGSRRFLGALGCVDVSMVVVDEAHCVSQWGKDFRPSYLRVGAFIRSFARRPVVCACTATATERVREDIVDLLGLLQPQRVVLGFDRPNLFFAVMHPQDKQAQLLELFRLYSGSAVVYCPTRREVNELEPVLSRAGLSVVRYHAGMPPDERKINQELFVSGKRRVIVATNAFGMGIDKPDVRLVVHCGICADLESYYQQAGRAGRDGKASLCVLLCDKHDAQVYRYFIETAEKNEELSPSQARLARRLRYQRLKQMTDYAEGDGCLRAKILKYFSESAPERCGFCSACAAMPEPTNEQADEREVERAKELYIELRRVRREVARKRLVPQFSVFKNSELWEIARSRPLSLLEFLKIPGVRRKKSERYAAIFIKKISLFIKNERF